MQKKCEKCRTTPDFMFHETGVYASGCPVDGKYAILARRLLGKVLSGNGSKVCKMHVSASCRARNMGRCQEKQGSCIHLPDGFGTGFSPDNSEKPFSGLPFPSFSRPKNVFHELCPFLCGEFFFAFKRLKNHSLEIKC